MKYKLVFHFYGTEKMEVEADRYHIQAPVVILEKKEIYDGQILRADEKYTPFRYVNLQDVNYIDIEELE